MPLGVLFGEGFLTGQKIHGISRFSESLSKNLFFLGFYAKIKLAIYRALKDQKKVSFVGKPT